MTRRQLIQRLAAAFFTAESIRHALAKEDADNSARHRTEIADFLAGPILTLKIELDREAIEALRKEPRFYVEGRLRVGDKLQKHIAFKLKGADGSFRPIDEKPCFTVNCDKFKGAERFRGMKKFHLNNAREDESFLRQTISGEVARAAGVPAVRCTHAFIELNGRDLGLYVLAEGYTKDFLSLFFTNTSGDLYEGGFCKDIDEGLIKDEGDPEDFRAIQQLLAACREDDAAARWQKLGAILDLDRFASFFAFEALAGVGDGYDFFHNNYRIYHDPRTRRLSFVLHSMDQPFGDAGFPIQRSPESIVGRAFIGCAEGRRLYRTRAAQLYEKVFAARDWPARAEELAKRVQASFAANGRKPDRQLAAKMEEFRETLRERVKSIASQLENLSEPLEFDKTGTARLVRGWSTKQEGDAKFEQIKDAHGLAALRIAVAGEAQASWRAPLQLAAGRYRFEARVKAAGVRDGKGACLRISGSEPSGAWVAGDAAWQPVQHVFEATEGGEVVLVAELRAGRGEVWFDSLQLVALGVSP